MKFPLFKLIPLFAMGVCFAPALLPAADEGSKASPPSDLVTRAYRSSSSFESALNRTWHEKQTVDKNADPFADPIPGAPNTLDFVTYLKSVLVDTYGITFPEGTFIKHDPE
ncbi:MAG: hypothetical protein GXP30_07020, partial [Verrucomicrobia bacterium]|nr:hypothetical protein [Verrucomicrobiota bacterium]